MIEVAEIKGRIDEKDNGYQVARARWEERARNAEMAMIEQCGMLTQLPGAEVVLKNTESDLYQIAVLLGFGDTRGLLRETLKAYNPIINNDRFRSDKHEIVFGGAVLVLPVEENRKTYEFHGGLQVAYRETVYAPETGRKYRIYVLSRELKDGEFSMQCTESGVWLKVSKVGSAWTLRLVPSKKLNGKAVQDFTLWVRYLKSAQERSQHPEPARTKLCSSNYYSE